MGGSVGLIWDLIQQGQLQQAGNRASTLEQRVDYLERELERTNRTLMDLLRIIERKFGEDIDSDGRVG